MPDLFTSEGREVVLKRLRPVFPAVGSAVAQHARPIAQSLGKVSTRTWAGAGGGVVALAAIALGLNMLFSPPKKPARKPVRARAATARAPAATAKRTRKAR